MTAPDSSSLSPQAFETLDIDSQTSLADTALRLAKKAGAASAAEEAGDRSLARAYYAKLQALAADHDSERPELAQARAFATSSSKALRHD